MKKTLTNLSGLGAICAFVAACAENPDGTPAVAYTIGLLCLAALLAWSFVLLLNKEQENEDK